MSEPKRFDIVEQENPLQASDDGDLIFYYEYESLENKLRELVEKWRAYSDIQAFMQANNTLKSCADELESLLEHH